MEEFKEEVKQMLIHRVKDNAFCKVMNLDVVEVGHGKLTMATTISPECHTNIYGYVHGGVFCGMADTASGVCCFTVGERVITLDMHLNFIKNVHAGVKVFCSAEIVQHGNKIMRTHCTIKDEEGSLLVDGSLNFYIIGKEDV